MNRALNIIGIILIILILSILLFIIYELKKEEKNFNTFFPHEYIGEFQATFYCPCSKCVGNKKVVKTATGNIPISNKTIAVDKNIIPLHSIVYIPDFGYFVAEDTGMAIKGHKIDIFVDNHEEALKLGKKKVDIYIMKKI